MTPSSSWRQREPSRGRSRAPAALPTLSCWTLTADPDRLPRDDRVPGYTLETLQRLDSAGMQDADVWVNASVESTDHSTNIQESREGRAACAPGLQRGRVARVTPAAQHRDVFRSRRVPGSAVHKDHHPRRFQR